MGCQVVRTETALSTAKYDDFEPVRRAHNVLYLESVAPWHGQMRGLHSLMTPSKNAGFFETCLFIGAKAAVSQGRVVRANHLHALLWRLLASN